MKIELKTTDVGQLLLYISNEESTEFQTRISSFFTKKVDSPIINDIHNLVTEAGRYNGLSYIECVKHFVENTLTEKDIMELIKKLEN